MNMYQTDLRPSPEQECARDLFLKNEGLRIDAYAGSGKTTTLRLLASSTSRRGLYLAFNRSIAEEARVRLPSHVTSSTGHSLAFRSVRQHYPEWKLTESLTPNKIVESFRMPDALTFQSGLTLPKWSYCSVLLEAVKRFLQSDDEYPQKSHILRYGCLEALEVKEFNQFADQAIGHVQSVWDAMLHKTAGLPLGHDGYLKLWVLSKPEARVDYILVDEAQDLNPVLLGMLRRIECPVVYVGDPYQQIYEWRGAINAMAQVSTPHRVLLSQSYRFGAAIADAATAVIRQLGAKHPVRGLGSIDSHIAQVRPQVILSRVNAGVMRNVLDGLSKGVPCHVLGGTKALEILLTDVGRVKHGQIAQSPELLGFTEWKEVMSFSTRFEGDYLRGLVNLVQEYGEDRMLRALKRCVGNEREALTVCTTTHKAKGREWDYVQVDSDFLSTSPSSDRPDREASLAAELRLLYVAITRAKRAVTIPSFIRERFGLKFNDRRCPRRGTAVCRSIDHVVGDGPSTLRDRLSISLARQK